MSEEQLRVVAACASGNCVVDSVAGSGKTTTCLLIAETYPTEKHLLLTYNSKLKLETRARVAKKGLTNLEVHSYHSFCVKFYHSKAYEDTVLKRIAATNVHPLKSFKFERIILDEAQDMTPMLFEVFRKVFHDNGPGRLCVLGDQKQSIYEFRHADARYLTLAPSIFSGAWTALKLSTTYRLTVPMAEFVNNCMLQETRLIAVKPSGVQPEYIVCNAFSDTIYDKVMRLLNEFAPEDFFLVAPSLRASRSPLIQLENKLVKKNVPCFVPISDDEIVDASILEGKIAFSTIHQTKGMERKVVIVFGFDDSYFKYYKKDVDPYTCPNELYVAATRATERLIFVHHEDNDYLPFLCRRALTAYEIRTSWRPCGAEEKSARSPIISVTDLLRHLDNTAMHCAYSKLRVVPMKAAGEALSIEGKVFGDTIESVNHITGTAIPTHYEFIKKEKMTILEKLRGREDFHDIHQHMVYLKGANRPPVRGLDQMEYPLSVQELLFTVNCWNACTNGYINQVQQIHTYDWLSGGMLEECTRRLNSCLETLCIDATQFETHCTKPDAYITGSTHATVLDPTHHPELKGRVLHGYIDLVGSDKLLEIKCTSALKTEHYLQTALYSYLHKASGAYIFNVLTEELVEVQCDDLPGMVEILMHAKFAPRVRVSSEEFIRACLAFSLPSPSALLAPVAPTKCSVCRKLGHNKSTCPDKACTKPVTPNATVGVDGIIGVFDIESSGHSLNELGMVLAKSDGMHLPQMYHCVTNEPVKGWAETGCPGLKKEALRSKITVRTLFDTFTSFIRENQVKLLMAHNGVASDFPTLIRAARAAGVHDPVGQLERAGITGMVDPARFIPQYGIRELQKDGKGYKSNEALYEMATQGTMESHGLCPHRALDDAKAERAWMPLIAHALATLPCATPLQCLREYVEQYDKHKQLVAC